MRNKHQGLLAGLVIGILAQTAGAADYGVTLAGNPPTPIPKYDRMTVRENNFNRITHLPAAKGAKEIHVRVKDCAPDAIGVWTRTLDYQATTEKVDVTVADGAEKDSYKVTLAKPLPEGRIFVVACHGQVESSGNVYGQYLAVASTSDIRPYVEKTYAEQTPSSAQLGVSTVKAALKAFPDSAVLKGLLQKFEAKKKGR